ncbi:hypothetical protein LguiA_018833 [Lonicera macranthoides]
MSDRTSREGKSDHPSSPPPPAVKVTGNEDLLREILLHLPVRSLLIFKLVSKHWYALISHPQFALDHTSRTNPSSLLPSALFFYHSLSDFREINFVWLNHNNNDNSLIPNQSSSGIRVRVPRLSFLDSASLGGMTRILGSCNGLLLCRLDTELNASEVELIHFCVCNPTTKTYRILPQATINQNESVLGTSLLFDPWDSPHHYRVVFAKHISNDFCVDIYSSQNGLWTTSVCRSRIPTECLFNPGIGVYWNGAIHWIGSNNGKWCSLQLNIHTNNSTITELPPMPSPSIIRYFGECSGHLHLVYTNDMLGEGFEVLEKDRDTLEWSIRYRVNMNQIVATFPEIIRDTELNVGRLITEHPQIADGIRNCRGAIKEKEYEFYIMCVVGRGEEEEDSELVIIMPGKFISYNLKHKMSRVLSEFPWMDLQIKNFFMSPIFPYIESLASV